MGFFNSILFIILSITFLLYQSIFHLPIVSAKDILMPGDELLFNYTTDSSSSTLSSSDGNFTLGFFTISPHTNDTTSAINLTYLGIWYTNEPESKRVWVANRDQPILGAAILIIDGSGILKVKSESGATLFNVSDDELGSSNNTRAMLQDSGNFIVYDEANQTIWQSFDYPTGTLIPGMNLGYILGSTYELTSWANNDVPTSGAFTLRLEQYQNSPQLLIHRRGELYWASGPWNPSTGNFQLFHYDVSFDLVIDPSGMYLNVRTIGFGMRTMQLSPYGQITIDTGTLQLSPNANDAVTPDFCYGYESDIYDGCVDSALPYCRARALASEIDTYQWGSRDIYYNGPNKTDDNSSISLGDCMERCWNDCTCVACSTYNNNGTGCIYWTEQNADDLDEGSNQIAVYALFSHKSPKTKTNFTLEFFTIQSTTSTNFTYLGIKYGSSGDGVGNGSIVWVANRDKPMTGSGVLMIDNLGTLKVVDGSGTTLFNISHTGNNNTRSVLEDSGNFLLYDATDNRTLWQSFDHPTDTLLPGMKIGYNLTTGDNWILTSSLSDQIPATGAFTMKLEKFHNSPQLVIYRRGEVYRASGRLKNGTSRVLDSLSFFNFPPDYNQSLIFDPSGSTYFTYQANNFMFQLSPDGHVNDNHSPIPVKDFCYGYKSYDGCTVSAMPNCRGQRDSFVLKSGDWTFGPSNNDVNSSISLSDCMERCWKDCNCVGFITSNSNGTGCITWVTNNTNKDVQYKDDPFGTRPQKYVLVSKKPVKIKRWMLVVVPLASVVLSILAVYLCYVRIRRRRLEEEENRRRDDILHELVGSNSFNYGDELERGIKDAPDVKVFSLKAIMAATSNFSNENKLGQGGYGPVYKGKLPDGREIAVKRLSKTSGQGIKEFKNELILISKLQHTNLVRLYGCCIHQEEKMLIYEFMPNKSLDFFLFDDDQKEKIDWRIRFNIIEGIAQGLLYLHKYSRTRVIHRDLKVSNILLDQNMNPKIADFGLARIFPRDVSEEMTKRVVGTYGYMAPEYAMHGTFSIKSDVFSFGVLILEIVNGKKNSSFYNYDMPLNLVGYAWELWKREATLELKDEALGESYDVKQLLKAIHVGLLCVQENANDRPTISEVISMLNNEITDLPMPKQPAFFIYPNEVEQSRPSERLLGNNIQGSVNGLTITTMQAR